MNTKTKSKRKIKSAGEGFQALGIDNRKNLIYLCEFDDNPEIKCYDQDLNLIEIIRSNINFRCLYI